DEYLNRHCERSEAIQGITYAAGLLRGCAARNDGGPAGQEVRTDVMVFASAVASVTGSEQVSPTQTNAAPPAGAAASLSRAGCLGGSALAAGTRSTMRSRSGSATAARA